VLPYQAENYIIINKPAGLVVHPAHGNYNGTLVNGLLYYFKELSRIGGEEKPGIVHRLDKDTSGIMIVCKTDVSFLNIKQQFDKRLIKKEYLALTYNLFNKKEGVIENFIGRNNKDRKTFTIVNKGGKQAVSRYKVIRSYLNFFSLVKIFPKTGRTHQIRVHLSHLGHPIVGDPVYGNNRKMNLIEKQLKFKLPQINRQLLHAARISFQHPITKKWLNFKAPLSSDFANTLKLLYQKQVALITT